MAYNTVNHPGEHHGDSQGWLQFLRPNGHPIPEAAPMPELHDAALRALADSLIEAGVDLEGMPEYPAWHGGALDLAAAMDGLRAVGGEAC